MNYTFSIRINADRIVPILDVENAYLSQQPRLDLYAGAVKLAVSILWAA
jgi:hypothetical protein